ncbi:hypothetical protein [Escherichia coli]|uniref:hypothetical protein n=1 Tax=Escherichia coli TaxID=562 RepID=UPI00398C4622
MYEPVKDTLESVVPEDTVNWLDNKGLFLASDWTPFFDRKEYEQYQASLSQVQTQCSAVESIFFHDTAQRAESHVRECSARYEDN